MKVKPTTAHKTTPQVLLDATAAWLLVGVRNLPRLVVLEASLEVAVKMDSLTTTIPAMQSEVRNPKIKCLTLKSQETPKTNLNARKLHPMLPRATLPPRKPARAAKCTTLL